MITDTDVRAAYHAALQLGAQQSYDDCIGGDLRVPDHTSPECEAAIAEYKQIAREHDRLVYGPERREYYR